MPKQMFFNISEEKRQHFLKAAKSEFTTKSFGEVSVNSIIKKAGIPRGSFYTYFEDLESLFSYLMVEVKEERFKYGRKILKQTKGDYFKFIRALFIYDFDAYAETGIYSLFRNYIHYLQQTKKISLKEEFISSSLSSLSNTDIHSSSVFNYNELGLNTEEFVDLIEVVILLMVNTYIKAESECLTKSQTIALFNRRLDFIEHGVCKSKKWTD